MALKKAPPGTVYAKPPPPPPASVDARLGSRPVDGGETIGGSYGNRIGGADDAVNRYRDLAGWTGSQTAPTIDNRLSMQSRGYQMGALGLLDQQARGNAPSAAEAMAKRNTDAAINAGQSLASSVKGGAGARVAAMRNAQNMTAQTMGQGAQRAEEARANEIARATGQLASTAQGMRQSDMGQAQAQASLEAQQRALNSQDRRFFEGLGHEVNKDQLDANLAGRSAGAAESNAATAKSQMKHNRVMDWVRTGAGVVAGGLGGLLSDPDIKDGVKGPLASLGLGGVPLDTGVGAGSSAVGSPTFDKMAPGGGMDVMGSLKAHSNFGTQFASRPALMMRSAMASKDPAGMMLSPGAAKTAIRPLGTPAPGSAEAMVNDTRAAGGYAPMPDIQDLSKIPQVGTSTAQGPAPFLDKYMAEEAAKPPSLKEKLGWQYYESLGREGSAAENADEINKAEARFIRDKFKREAETDKETGGKKEGKKEEAKPALKGWAGGLVGALGGIADPSSVGMRSDSAAKEKVGREAYLLGRAHEMEARTTGKDVPFAHGGPPKKGEEIIDRDPHMATDPAVNPTLQAKKEAPDDSTFSKFRHVMDRARAMAALPDSIRSDAEAKKVLKKEAPLAESNRSMSASSYKYKEGLGPPEQVPGEVNVGPMADNMAADDVARTAIKREPDTGLLMIDKDKGLKLVMGGLASLQKQVDAIAKGGGRRA